MCSGSCCFLCRVHHCYLVFAPGSNVRGRGTDRHPCDSVGSFLFCFEAFEFLGFRNLLVFVVIPVVLGFWIFGFWGALLFVLFLFSFLFLFSAFARFVRCLLCVVCCLLLLSMTGLLSHLPVCGVCCRTCEYTLDGHTTTVMHGIDHTSRPHPPPTSFIRLAQHATFRFALGASDIYFGR